MAGGFVGGDVGKRAELYEGRITSYFILACIVGSLGGSLFGYDLGVSGGWRDTTFRKVGSASVLSGNSSSTKKRAPLSVRKACSNYVQNHQHIKSNDWHIEISFPKSHAMPLPGAEQKGSEGHFIAKAFDRIAGDAPNWDE